MGPCFGFGFGAVLEGTGVVSGVVRFAAHFLTVSGSSCKPEVPTTRWLSSPALPSLGGG